MVIPTRVCRDKGGLGDEQRPRSACTLAIVLDSDIAVDVVLVSAVARERGEHNTVLQVDVADGDGLEQFGVGRH